MLNAEELTVVVVMERREGVIAARAGYKWRRGGVSVLR